MKRIRRQECKDCNAALDDATYKATFAVGRCVPCYKSWYKAWYKKYYEKGSLRAKAFNFNRNRARAKFKEMDLDSLIATQERKCRTCGIDLSNVKWEIDHIMPVSVGGTHDPANLQILCKRCNRAKDNGSMEEFLTWTHHIAERANQK